MAREQEETRSPEAATGGQKDARPQQAQTRQPAQPQSRPTETGMARHRQGSPPARQGGWGSLTRLRDEFDRLFDQFSHGWLGLSGGRESNWGLDVREDDNNVMVRAEAPGFEPGDFDIQVRGDQLIMSASRRAEDKKEEEGYRGWRRSEFYEAVTLPADVDPDKVKASYRSGVLTVTLPKSEGGKARHITVEG